MIKRILNKLKSIKFQSDRKDPITGKKIKIPSDVLVLGNELASWTVPKGVVNSDSVCYLVGAGEDISFDIALANTNNCKVFIFDPTPRAIAHYNKVSSDVSEQHPVTKYRPNTSKYVTFTPVGMWSEDTVLKFYSPANPDNVSHSVVNLQKTDTYFEAKVMKISSLMKEFGHSEIDMLKIDIEGAEYEVLKSLIKEKVYPRIICIEYDEVFNPEDDQYRSRINESLDSLVAVGYKIYHLDYPGNYTLIR